MPAVLVFTHALNALLMLAMPVALGFYLARRLGARWSLYGVGALTFIASQGVHVPLNFGLTALFNYKILPAPPAAWHPWFNPVVLGLTAGLCEEVARYVVYRWWIKSARSWREALMFGAGHGGIEAIFVGLSALAAFATYFFLQRGGSLNVVPPEQQPALAQQLAAYWSAPWPLTLLGAVERAFALCVHLGLSVLVLQAFKRRNAAWLVGAILWHAASDTTALLALPVWGAYWTEAVIGAFALASLAMLFALRPKAGEAELPPTEPQPGGEALPAPIAPARASAADAETEVRRRLDETKYE
jgi:uncharacterized membrane protein YhfC